MSRMASHSPTPTDQTEQPLICGGCDYDLRRTEEFCPECGRRFDANVLSDRLVPWEQRRFIGRVRAYRRTAYLGAFRPWEIGDKAVMPVSYRSARLFRRVTVALTWLPLVLLAVAIRADIAPGLTSRGEDSEWSRLLTSPWSFGIGLFGLIAGTAAATSATAALFRTRGRSPAQQGRAQAIACYACAPLTLVPVVIGTYALATVVSDHSLAEIALQKPPIRALAVAGGLLALWLRSSLWMLRRATGCGTVRLIGSGLSLPVIWTASIVLIPVALEVLVAFVAMIVVSFS